MLLLVLDMYARYVEHIPQRMISANADSLATMEDIRVVRVSNNDGSLISQRVAVMIQDGDSAEMRDDDGHHNGYVFANSHST